MISDEERREAVARLRELAGMGKDGVGARGAEWFARQMEIATGTDTADTIQDMLERYADLIDRPTCTNVSGYQDRFKCSACWCDVEIIGEICNEHGEAFSAPYTPFYCPCCGAEVVE